VTGHLLAVWTFWQSTSTYTAQITDSQNNGTGNPPVFPSAIGPTLQSATSTPTSAQIFYAANITGSGVGHNDTVTVTFTCTSTPTICASATVPSAGVVAVEYSGADQNYPLDSVSAGYSYSVGGYMDSGTAAPANANLLVFGGGVNDNNTLPNPGSGFTNVQSNGGTGSITEQLITTSPNNTLQRATACLSGLSPCPAAPAGNWLMQMAVFRDASWTVDRGWTPARVGQIVDASQFPGSDIGAQVVNAYAALPSTGGTILVPSSANCYQYSTPITFTTAGKPATLQGTGTSPTCLLFTPANGNAITLDWGSSISAGGGASRILNCSSL